MRHLKFFTLTILFGLVFSSCDPCENLDCPPPNYYGHFRIVDAADGKDLVFGPSKIYDKNQIKFYSLNSADTTFFNYQTIKFSNANDSSLSVRFFPEADIAYMRLSNGDVDTLHISYNTFNIKCCGTTTEVANFRFNNSIDIPGNKGTQEIRK